MSRPIQTLHGLGLTSAFLFVFFDGSKAVARIMLLKSQHNHLSSLKTRMRLTS